MPGFVDLHHHIVYGIDDGPETIEDSIRMLKAAEADGISHIIATSHADPAYFEFDFYAYSRRLGELNDHVQRIGGGMTLHSGAEILYSDAVVRALDEKRVPTMANTEFVLMEFEVDSPYLTIYDAIRKLANAGYVPVIAHVERYTNLMKNVQAVWDLKQMFNVRFQVNCSTLIGRHGLRLRRSIKRMLSEGIIDYVATDAHNTTYRRAQMSECFTVLEAEYTRELATKVTGLSQMEILLP